MGWKARRDAYRSEVMRRYEYQQEQLARGNFWSALGHRTLRMDDGEIGIHVPSSYQTETGERITFAD